VAQIMAAQNFMVSKAIVGDLSAGEETQLVIHLQDAENQNLKLREKLLEMKNLKKENERLKAENAQLKISGGDATELERLRIEVQNLRKQITSIHKVDQPTGPSVSVKTQFRNDVRCWSPQTNHPFKELLEFIEVSYDSTYVITYRDLEGDSIRVASDDDCRRAFSLAQRHGWDTVKLNIELRAEAEFRKELVSLELRNKKLKKQLQKFKKSASGMKKGQILLDAIYHKDGFLQENYFRRLDSMYTGDKSGKKIF